MAYPMMLNLEKMSCRILRVYADSKKQNTDTSAVVSLLMQLYLAIDYNLTENRQYMRHILRYICRHSPPYIFIWIFNVSLAAVSPFLLDIRCSEQLFGIFIRFVHSTIHIFLSFHHDHRCSFSSEISGSKRFLLFSNFTTSVKLTLNQELISFWH